MPAIQLADVSRDVRRAIRRVEEAEEILREIESDYRSDPVERSAIETVTRRGSTSELWGYLGVVLAGTRERLDGVVLDLEAASEVELLETNSEGAEDDAPEMEADCDSGRAGSSEVQLRPAAASPSADGG